MSVKKIQLEIYSDKADKFYLALLKYKLSGKADPETLKELADAIHFDTDSLTNSIDLSPESKQAIQTKLSEIHAYLLASKKDSKDYFAVSRENPEKFLASPFGKELYDMLFMMELMKQCGNSGQTDPLFPLQTDPTCSEQTDPLIPGQTDPLFLR